MVRSAPVARPARPSPPTANGLSPPDRRIRRPVDSPGTRAVVGALLMTVAAVGVLVAYRAAGDDPEGAIVVAASSLPAGQVLSATDLRAERVDLPGAVRGTFSDPEDLVGRVVLAPVEAGEVVSASAVTDDVRPQAHEVAAMLPREQVAVGRLKQGERVDLYVTTDESTRSVARGVRVVTIGSSEEASLTSTRHVNIVVAVDDAASVAALVHALRTGEVTVVRSTVSAESPEAVVFDGASDRGDDGDRP